jgi:hypothetical protein
LITGAATFDAVRRASKWVVYLTMMGTCSLVVGLVVVGSPRVSTWLLLSLESRFPKWETGLHGPPDGIIVLSGESGERMTVMTELSLRFPQARLVYSGFARFSDVKDSFKKNVHLGGEPARITMETRSRNTFENAVYSSALIRPNPDERWLLITSAVHMPRAVGSFRHAGFNVEAYPVNFTQNSKDVSRGQARGGEFAYREWIALVAYRLLGRTDALFPGP